MENNNQENNELHIKDTYIEEILVKLDDIEDNELKILIHKLIDERNYLSKIANIDTLTGLNNRRILGRIRKTDGVIMVDIDDFKRINDAYGHDVGDEVIKSVANALMNSICANDYICRFGGDEFIIAFSDCPEHVIRERTNKISEVITERIKVFNDIITVSIGIAINKDDDDINSLIKKADMALYESKKQGKKQISEFEHQKHKTLKKIKKLSNF